MPQRADFRVREMDCADEVAALRRELIGRAGIVAVDCDVLHARLSVTYDDTAVAPEDIIGWVASTGMTAVPWADQSDSPREETFWLHDRRAVLTMLGGGMLLLGFVSHWILSGYFLSALRGVSPPWPVVASYFMAALCGAWLVLPRALAALRRLRADMNLLMCIAVVGAMILGDWLEAAVASCLFSLSLLLEQWSLGRTRRAIAELLDLTPPTARFLCPTHGTVEEQRVDTVPVGVTVLVRPGERIPLDGVVLAGESHVNEAPITGESLPALKQAGAEVFAGTINGDGSLEFRVTKPAGDTTLARIVRLVEEAQARKAPREQWVERFAAIYTPAMLLLAVVIAVAPALLGNVSWTESLYRGLVTLVIACPCALVISTPVSIVSAITSAARNGVLIRGGVALEAAAHIQAGAFDKTGTLTVGHPAVQRVIPFDGHTSAELLERAAALEGHSQHPLAQAILRRADAESIHPARVATIRQLKGRGAEGEFDGRPFWIGSHRLMHEKGQETPEVHQQALALEDAGHSVVAVGNAEHVCGLFSIADTLRPEAQRAVEELRRAGVRHIELLTGDNEQTARDVARAIGADAFHAELLPEEKLQQVKTLVRDYSRVAMIGDGVNDAPALAAATLGVAMGAIGSAAAIETADVALMSDDLRKVPWLVHHARRTLAVIQQNIVFALGLKLLFIVLTVMGYSSLWLAIAADTGATLLVIANALRLLAVHEAASR